MAGITFTEGAGLQDSIYGKSQAPIRMFLEQRGEAFEQQSIIKEIFQMGKSTHWGEKFTAMTAMDGFQPVGENGAYPSDNMQEGFDKFLEHMTWKNSFALSREIVEDAKLMDLKRNPQLSSPATTEPVRSSAQHCWAALSPATLLFLSQAESLTLLQQTKRHCLLPTIPQR